ncbi:hypothetical protein PUMCH_001411 [Australozyma saopauloensis]|uniref:Zinc transporter n=1 Tax=Australozyma saopauloensis TaxID=291208 RepID=A0AAX4H6Z7_9ASCO|nr:hypothetical protein PUMCH_001411 [[Candida] saopauloensis]
MAAELLNPFAPMESAGKRPLLEPIPSGLLVNSISETQNIEKPPKQLRPRIVRANETQQKLVTTLPVLITLPLLVVSVDLTLVPLTNNHLLGRVGAAFVVACVIVGLSQFPAKYGLMGKRAAPESWTVVLGLVLLFLAPMSLSYTRVAVTYFCLFLNVWNLYTPLALFCDCYLASSAVENPVLEVAGVVSGYTLLIGLHFLIERAIKSRKSSSGDKLILIFIMLGVGVVGAVVLTVLNLVNPIFLGITLAVGAVLMLLTNRGLVYSSLSILIVAVFSFVFEHYIVTTKPASVKGAFVSAVLPLVVKIKPSTYVENDDLSEEPEKPRVLEKILAHSDTRAIFNFLLLNTTFMFIQLVYSFKSKSLGLLSDSLHMALDCASLALGLVAGTLLKQEVDINSKFPFGLRHFEILAGFANGTLLVGISGSIIFEAVGRLYEPVELLRTTELIIVSTLGLLVNIVGIFAFNHGHHGHSHGHSHGGISQADHGSEHKASELGHSHSHSHSHSHTHSHEQSHSEKHETSHSNEDCEGMNDNMRGIFLHIMADTLGSVGVVISTILTTIFKWQGFDPVASIAIAVLIFVSAGPLMSSTASTLLLKLDNKKESVIRNCLNDLTTIRGIKSFSTPRFWAKGSGLTGYIHIQVYRGENISNLRAQCQRVFKSHNVEAMIQMEKDFDSCWCRDT